MKILMLNTVDRTDPILKLAVSINFDLEKNYHYVIGDIVAQDLINRGDAMADLHGAFVHGQLVHVQ